MAGESLQLRTPDSPPQSHDAPDVLRRMLAEPFAANEIEWRVQSSGKKRDNSPWVMVVAYVDNRAIMERLDEVCGVGGWRNEFQHPGAKSVLCGLSIKIDGEWITKWDGADATDIESTKGGLSNAMKRAAVQWGIGRYLYELSEHYAKIAKDDDRAAEYLKADAKKHGDALRWRPPALPAWALPGGSGKPSVASPQQEQRAAQAETTLRTTAPAKPAAAKVATPPATSATPDKPDKLAESARLNGVSYEDVLLPGSRTSLQGFGGKRVRDVPTRELAIIADTLRNVGGEKHNKYADVIAALDSALALRGDTARSA